jgi:high-affinity nickel-transport protein
VLSAALLGFSLGVRHALDPDHVAAIAAMVARHGRAGVAARIGAAWGLGHSLTILALGGVLVALHITVEPRWTLAAELLVAAILVALGVSNLRRVRRPAPARARAAAHSVGSAARALGIGVAHGLGGSAAVALLALAAMPTTASALAYLVVFGVGTVAGMLLLSFGLGVPLCAARRRPDVGRWALAGSGVVSIAAGLVLAYAVSTTALP